jgi:methionine-rich copper-binding protein CopC
MMTEEQSRVVEEMEYQCPVHRYTSVWMMMMMMIYYHDLTWKVLSADGHQRQQ